MGQQFSSLVTKHIEFIEKQKIFFVGTAADTGKVNLSPKGGDSLKVINENTIAWLNYTGSGNESAAHTLINPRMTIMWCAFEGAPLILRAYGNAKPIHQGDKEWSDFSSLFAESTGDRQIFVLDISMVQSSCGMSIPYFAYESERDDLENWSNKIGKDGIKKYWEKKNQRSLDGFDTEILKRSS